MESSLFGRTGGKYEEERCTGYSLANALRPKRDGELFEHFLVVGLPKSFDASSPAMDEPLHYEPEILYQYPPNEEKALNTNYVAQFCFPRGVSVQCVQRTQSASGRLELLFGQFSKVEKTDSSFIFMITNDQHLLYGVCVTQMELVADEGSFFTRSSEPPSGVTRKKFDCFSPRCYCFLTRFPFFKVHFEVLYSLLAKDRLRRVASAVGVEEGEEEEGTELDILKTFHSFPVPRESNALSFHLPGELRAVEFVCPPGDEDKQLAEWGFVCLFKLLSLNNILTLFRSVMLERSTIFVCPDVGILSAVVLAVLPMLRPYVFQGPFIPILPTGLSEFLDSPVPYVIGVPHLPDDFQREEKTVVRILENSIESSSRFPYLPEQKKLFDSLKPFHSDIHKSVTHVNPCASMSPSCLENVKGISAAFRSYQHWLMDEVIIPHVDTKYLLQFLSLVRTATPADIDFTNEEKVKQFVAAMPKDYRKFSEAFLQSQQFNSYADKLLEIIQKRGLVRLKPALRHKKSLSSGDVEALLRVVDPIIKGHKPKNFSMSSPSTSFVDSDNEEESKHVNK